MRIIVDMNRCESNQICVGLAPDVFAMDDDDRLVLLVDHADESRRADIVNAARQCPRQVITVEED